jgi:copper resistance protein C
MKCVAAAAGGLLALLIAASALAHAEPQRVFPGEGAVVTRPPAEVIIEMTQEMLRDAGANDIVVTDATGRQVTVVAAVIDNANRRRLRVPLPSDLGPGEYIVNWKTLSAEDGDRASGSYRFTYDPAGTPHPGRELVRESLLGGADSGPPASSLNLQGRNTGVTWILFVAVAAGALVLGGGGAFLFAGRRE